jgi:hypothetical protein
MAQKKKKAQEGTTSYGRIIVVMKPAPAPHVAGNTEAEKFDNAVRKVFSVSKEAYLKEEARLKKLRERKKRAKKS